MIILPGNPDIDHERQAKFDEIAKALPGFGGMSLEVRFGTQTLTFTASNVSATATVTHGLNSQGKDRTPAIVQLSMQKGTGQFFIAMWSNKTSTTFDIQGISVNGSTTATVSCDWLAIG